MNMPIDDFSEIHTREEFTRALSDLRVNAQLTIRSLSAHADIPFSTVGGYFSGRHLPSGPRGEDHVRAILRACSVPEHNHDTWIHALRRIRSQVRRAESSSKAASVDSQELRDRSVYTPR